MNVPELVTIGIPVWNGENFLRETLDSILSQTYRNLEVIISDNASTDGTRSIGEEYAGKDARVSYLRHPENLGAVANYNSIFEHCRGRYFMWHAHDDLLEPTFVEKAVGVLDADPGVSLCFSGIRYIDASGAEVRRDSGYLSLSEPEAYQRLRSFVGYQKDCRDIFWAIFGLTRREILEREGLFKRFVASDQALLLRLVLSGRMHVIPEPLFQRRIHAQASTVLLPRREYRERARWYSMRSDYPFVLPNWQLLFEDLRTVFRRGLSPVRTLRCVSAVFWMFALRSRKLSDELVSIPGQLLYNLKSIRESAVRRGGTARVKKTVKSGTVIDAGR